MAKKVKYKRLTSFLLGLFVILLAISAYMLYQSNEDFKAKLELIEEMNSPAEISITVLGDIGCEQCFEITPVLNQIKSANVNITETQSYDHTDMDAKETIKKYAIERAPALVVEGEIDKIKDQLAFLSEKQGALVFDSSPPPYTDIATNEVVGLVAVTLLQDNMCKQCSSMAPLLAELKNSGLKVSVEQNISSRSEQGEQIIELYNITKLPTLIFSKDLEVYPFSENWESVGSIESDGSYILRDIQSPYVDLTTNNIRGFVDIVMLTDSACQECYDVKIHLNVLKSNFGIYFDSEKKIDIATLEGEELIGKYDITKVPTIVLTGDLDAYPSIKQVWETVGSIEDDGAYVFRDMTQIQGSVYKDLESGEVVK